MKQRRVLTVASLVAVKQRRVLTVASLLAAGAAAVVSLGGCGSAANIVDPVARAAVVSNQSPGYRMNLSMQLSSPALPAPITATGHGNVDVAGHKASVTLDMNLGNIPQVKSVLGSSTLSFQELVDGTTIYVKLPPELASKIPTFTKPWLKLDPARGGSAAGIPGLSSVTSNPASSEPSQLLRFLRAESGSVTKLGGEVVGGVPTTRYRATVSLDRVPNAFPPASRAQVRQTVAGLERVTHAHLLPVNVWVDDHHLVRRMRFAFNENIAGAGPVGVVITTELTQYGPQPSPSLPPASQVQDISGLASGSG